MTHAGIAARISAEVAQQVLDAVGLREIIAHLEGRYPSDVAQQMLYSLTTEGIVFQPKTGVTHPQVPYAPIQRAYAA